MLNEAEKYSPLWLKLTEHYRARLQKLREQADVFVDEGRARERCGRIAEINAFLALADEKKPPVEVVKYESN